MQILDPQSSRSKAALGSNPQSVTHKSFFGRRHGDEKIIEKGPKDCRSAFYV